MKNQNGVTVVVLVLTVLIMIIILGTITFTSKSSFKMNQYYKMCSDIKLLEDKIALYYLEHKKEKNDFPYGLPIFEEQASKALSDIAIEEGKCRFTLYFLQQSSN